MLGGKSVLTCTPKEEWSPSPVACQREKNETRNVASNKSSSSSSLPVIVAGVVVVVAVILVIAALVYVKRAKAKGGGPRRGSDQRGKDYPNPMRPRTHTGITYETTTADFGTPHIDVDPLCQSSMSLTPAAPRASSSASFHSVARGSSLRQPSIRTRNTTPHRDANHRPPQNDGFAFDEWCQDDDAGDTDPGPLLTSTRGTDCGYYNNVAWDGFGEKSDITSDPNAYSPTYSLGVSPPEVNVAAAPPHVGQRFRSFREPGPGPISDRDIRRTHSARSPAFQSRHGSSFHGIRPGSGWDQVSPQVSTTGLLAPMVQCSMGSEPVYSTCKTDRKGSRSSAADRDSIRYVCHPPTSLYEEDDASSTYEDIEQVLGHGKRV